MERRFLLTQAAASVAVAGLVLGGCSGQGKEQEAKPLPVTAKGPESSPSDPKHEPALVAYRAMWRDLAIASETSDAYSPLLDDHATGDALALMEHGLRKAKEEQVISKGKPRVDPSVVSSSSREVTVQDCVDGTGWLQYKPDGKLKNDVPGSHSRADATVRLDGGSWKVSKLYFHEAGSC
ncbi:hypothetical protein [Streptomyces sp. F63]|uniref:hypothetical protein n=1 Tax=Streptomyces sp. F63 TaxID=2824887 RepID=UPI001FFC95AC|nr:hypothetical protein [Streptomyces sp. F63]